MSIEFKRLQMTVDTLTTAVKRLARAHAFGNRGSRDEILNPLLIGLDDVQREMYHYIVSQESNLEDDKPRVRLEQIIRFLRDHGKMLLVAQEEQDRPIRVDENNLRRYQLDLGNYTKTKPDLNSLRCMQVPQAKLVFNFNFYKDPRESSPQLVEEVMLVITGGPMGEWNSVTATPIPDDLIPHDLWVNLLREMFLRLDLADRFDLIDQYFPAPESSDART